MFKKRSVKQGAAVKRKKVGVCRLQTDSADGKTEAMPELKGRPLMGLAAGDSYKEHARGPKKIEREDVMSVDSKFKLSIDEKTHDDRNPEPTAKSSTKGGVAGPPGNIKTTVLTDFQPDVCKDYKQTGYCGYGDSCKFLHSRDDFKIGWKLNKEWEIDGSTPSKQDDIGGIPFKCVICRNNYKSPIVTNCGHYFCSDCFTQRVRKDPSCAICGGETHGVAKIAKNLKSILKRQGGLRQDM